VSPWTWSAAASTSLAPSIALMTDTSDSMLIRPMAAKTDSMVRALT
jgi:hypothetical protein